MAKKTAVLILAVLMLLSGIVSVRTVHSMPAIAFDSGSAKGCGPSVSNCSTLLTTVSTGELLLMDVRDDCGSQIPTVTDTSSTNWASRFAGVLISGTTYVTELWSVTSAPYTNDNITVSGCTGKWSFGVVAFTNVRISNPFAGSLITANSGGGSGGPNANIVFTGLQSGEAVHVLNACVIVSGNCSTGIGNPPTGFTVLIQDSVINTAYQVLTAGQASLSVSWTSGTWAWVVAGDVICPASGASCGGQSQGTGCGTIQPFPGGVCSPVPTSFTFQTSTLCPLGNSTLSIGCYNVPSQLTSPQVGLLVTLLTSGVLISTIFQSQESRRGSSLSTIQLSPIRNKKASRLLEASFLTASLTLGFDFVFHLTQTSPMEVPVYFAMKFLSALPIAYYLIPRVGVFWSALVFTVWVDIYYGLFVVYLGIYQLSSSPNQVIPIDGIMNQLILFPLWTLAHGVFFLVAAELADRQFKVLIKPDRRTSLV